MIPVPFLSRKLPSDEKTADVQATVILVKEMLFLGSYQFHVYSSSKTISIWWQALWWKLRNSVTKYECYKMCGYLATGGSNIWILDSAFPFSPNIFISWKTPIKKKQPIWYFGFFAITLYFRMVGPIDYASFNSQNEHIKIKLVISELFSMVWWYYKL